MTIIKDPVGIVILMMLKSNHKILINGLIYLIMNGVMMLYSNGLFAQNLDLAFPAFSKISIAKLEADVDNKITNYQRVINKIADDPNVVMNWEQLLQPIEDAAAELENVTNIISHLNSVKDSAELRKVYTNILPKLSNLSAEFLQNKILQQKIVKLKDSAEFTNLGVAQQKIIDNLLLDFKLAGVNLAPEQQARYKEITALLSELSNKFSKNILDATQSWNYYISPKNKRKLNGLPKHFVELAQAAAVKQGFKDGWLLTLDLPCVDVVMRHAKDRAIRKVVHKAYVTKASEKFKTAFSAANINQNIEAIAEFDNSSIMHSIIKLRAELALLLGFNNYSEYSLAHKMAKSTKEVINFLDELATNSVPVAKKELLALQNFAKAQDNLTKLQSWDIGYYAEQYKEKLFNLSEEELRNYFQLKHVLSGVFKLANSLYGINIQEVTDFDSWDPEVKLYKVIDRSNNLRGYFYTDLYVRENKQSGAWMANCLSRHKWQNLKLQYPVAFLITNFTKPTAENGLLYHQELVTLLHEFGHVLHHILTKVDYVSASGCNGVAWDAVELPSQFMEKWAYDWQFLQDVSLHKDTQEKMSTQMFDSLIGIKNYQAGMFMARQLEFGIFDFTLHMWSKVNNDKQPNIRQVLDQTRSKVTVVPVASFNRFENSFSHIFSGGYAAGYYSYNWAEVLASDAFMFFHTPAVVADPVATAKLGAAFLENILEMGGSRDPMDLYVAFRGKKPSIGSLLEYKGLKK